LEAALHGRPLGLWPLEVAQRLGRPVVYITGSKVLSFLDPAQAKVITNPDLSRGLGRSIALAASHARAAGAERLLVMLGDMPFVSAETLQRLIEQTPTTGASACRYGDGALGPPACFGSDLFEQLTQLDGDTGARHLLRQATALVVDERELRDVDTAQQLAELNRQPPPA
jgi:molybdenum cofactor cytidylyltransferase